MASPWSKWKPESTGGGEAAATISVASGDWSDRLLLLLWFSGLTRTLCVPNGTGIIVLDAFYYATSSKKHTRVYKVSVNIRRMEVDYMNTQSTKTWY